ncbi:hydrolase, alpha/beta fold family [Burkholderia pseudomallei Pakistan 9]|nr:hydrolase, alpha/beta fold family [Burkholderia pseudomallei Pakistan 9]
MTFPHSRKHPVIRYRRGVSPPKVKWREACTDVGASRLLHASFTLSGLDDVPDSHSVVRAARRDIGRRPRCRRRRRSPLRRLPRHSLPLRNSPRARPWDRRRVPPRRRRPLRVALRAPRPSPPGRRQARRPPLAPVPMPVPVPVPVPAR